MESSPAKWSSKKLKDELLKESEILMRIKGGGLTANNSSMSVAVAGRCQLYNSILDGRANKTNTRIAIGISILALVFSGIAVVYAHKDSEGDKIWQKEQICLLAKNARISLNKSCLKIVQKYTRKKK